MLLAGGKAGEGAVTAVLFGQGTAGPKGEGMTQVDGTYGPGRCPHRCGPQAAARDSVLTDRRRDGALPGGSATPQEADSGLYGWTNWLLTVSGGGSPEQVKTPWSPSHNSPLPRGPVLKQESP